MPVCQFHSAAIDLSTAFSAVNSSPRNGRSHRHQGPRRCLRSSAHTEVGATGRLRRSAGLETVQGHHLGSPACKPLGRSPVLRSRRQTAPRPITNVTDRRRSRCIAWSLPLSRLLLAQVGDMFCKTPAQRHTLGGPTPPPHSQSRSVQGTAAPYRTGTPIRLKSSSQESSDSAGQCAWLLADTRFTQKLTAANRAHQGQPIKAGARWRTP